jgi:hypothetical protein
MDTDLEQMSREELVEEVKKLRQGIREHRDSTRHELCWHHPALWGLLPEKTDPIPEVPDWPQFLQGCLKYRQSLDEQLPDAPRTRKPYQDAADAPASPSIDLPTLQNLLWKQLGAAIDMLENALLALPDDLWGDLSNPQQAWYSIYHTGRCGIEWLDCNNVEALLYNMRHVQHHAAQLNLLLRQVTGEEAPRWVKRAQGDVSGT